MPARPTTVQLRAAGVGLVVDLPADGPPVVLHWGADLGALDDDGLAGLRLAAAPAVPSSALDERWSLSLLPGEADGWSGRPALRAHVGGRAVLPRWTTTAAEVRETADGAREAAIRCEDPAAGLAVDSTLRLEASGLLRARHALVRDVDAEGVLDLAGLDVLLPVPADAVELLDLTGRWCRERSPQRQPFHHGTRLRESRRGRTGHDAPLLLAAGTAGFGFGHGEVWGAHVAWSGDHVHLAERFAEGAGQAAGVLGGGELLRPGEVRLGPGESYRTPWTVLTWSDQGLDGAAHRVHRWLRSRPGHPASPRPLVLNTWEAVYFDHDADRLRALADVAARVGVERFVLDDGWFPGRRHDRAGLGDWVVDTGVWPDGLHPLVDHVRALGMRVGLWVEPEMVNLDSDLAREHPDWLLAAPDRLPRAWRHQHTLDLGRPEVRAYLLERLGALVAEYGLDYLKWDHNRDLHEAVRAPTGAAGVRAQTLGVYAVLDALRERHPGLEVESCSSGGARVDLGVLERADRVWASDTNDALERQRIQRWTQQLLPPELVGSHVGPPVAHTTGRTGDLAFRCLTALFGHAGLEWDLTSAGEAELAVLTRWSALYREVRGLLHSGDVVRADSPDPGAWTHGVVAADGSEALLAYARLDTSPEAQPGRVRLPGLDPRRRYRVRVRDELSPRARGEAPPAWFDGPPPVLGGAVLGRAGLAMPVLDPGAGVLLHLTDAGT
ncbi:alpha-galactosidase [Actinorugispora endophytica]|uniref:alpha-galactosidase n=1 Tax=Actinorugispora endophytica TaxID=1605990 RepID=A0A4R6V2L9_9ACTN|nr:alpha-galactosidase [Actinorugispora endophytica]TDQ54192.1 alpha-galactosidase [Actinorugispora endophytica]